MSQGALRKHLAIVRILCLQRNLAADPLLCLLQVPSCRGSLRQNCQLKYEFPLGNEHHQCYLPSSHSTRYSFTLSSVTLDCLIEHGGTSSNTNLSKVCANDSIMDRRAYVTVVAGVFCLRVSIRSSGCKQRHVRYSDLPAPVALEMRKLPIVPCCLLALDSPLIALRLRQFSHANSPLQYAGG